MSEIIGCGQDLHRQKRYWYFEQRDLATPAMKKRALHDLNQGRDNSRMEAVIATYYYELTTSSPPMEALVNAAKMLLEHGTIKPWADEGPAARTKPENYDEYMSWITDIQLLGHNGDEGVECGLLKIAYPLILFDKRGDSLPPLAQMMEVIAGEAMFAFSFYQGAKLVDLELPPTQIRKFPGQCWPHQRIREYLGLKPNEPLIGTIVKPKTGLTPELFSECVVEAAKAGARFTKADENMHLPLSEIGRYVGRVVTDLTAAGFDLTRNPRPKGIRFLFAPHVTTDADQMRAYAKAALDAGANALMFSPYYGGGFLKMAEIIAEFDVPVYAHTAGMNVMAGSPVWGMDPRIMYLYSALCGAAFMQITTMNGYLKPDDDEKKEILRCLQAYGLEGDNGMTLAIAGGMGPKVLGYNLKALGGQGRMFLAGTSVYSHPDGPAAGVKAMILAYQAYQQKQITEVAGLKQYATDLGAEGTALLNAL